MYDKVHLSPIYKGSYISLSDDNMTLSMGIPSSNYNMRSSIRTNYGVSKGKWYWEISGRGAYVGGYGHCTYGICSTDTTMNFNDSYYISGNNYTTISFDDLGSQIRILNYPNDYDNITVSTTEDLDIWVAHKGTFGIMLDLDNCKLSVRSKENYYRTITIDKDSYYVGSGYWTTKVWPYGTIVNTYNFGYTPFTFSLPQGYKPYYMCTWPDEDSIKLY